MTPRTEASKTRPMNEAAIVRTYRSPKLGDVSYTASDVVRFAQGLPGFERLRDFLLVTREECAPFVFLASLEDPEVALPLLPWIVAAGAHVAALPSGRADGPSGGADGPSGRADGPSGRTDGAAPVPAIACYAVASIGPLGRDVVANLRAPVLVDLDDRSGRQVILADETLPLTAPVK